jgi:hypothetical protein
MTLSVRLDQKIPPELVDEFVKKLSYISESLISYDLDPAAADSVIFELRPGHHRQAELVSSRIREVADKLTKGRREQKVKVLVNRKDRDISFSTDPHPILESMDEIRKYGEGRFGFGPRLVELMNLFDRDLRTIASRIPAVPHQFPTMIGADVMDRCRYLRSFPSALTMVSHLREDLGVIQDFAKAAAWDGQRLVCDPAGLSTIECLLAPSICFHYYAWLANRSINSTCVTAIGKCFRYESKSMVGLERLWDFTMREVVFAGPGKYVIEQRQKVIDETAGLLDKWELAYEIKSATDPFFVEDYAAMTAFQLAFELKFEILAPLPYRDKDLAIGSFNYHQDFFGRSFSISCGNGEPIQTSCVGFGLERVALAFLAQHGLDPSNWPAAIANEMSNW